MIREVMATEWYLLLKDVAATILADATVSNGQCTLHCFVRSLLQVDPCRPDDDVTRCLCDVFGEVAKDALQVYEEDVPLADRFMNTAMALPLPVVIRDRLPQMATLRYTKRSTALLKRAEGGGTTVPIV